MMLAVLLAAAITAPSDGQQVRRGDPPAWVKPSALLSIPENVAGPVFVRRQDILIHLMDGRQAQYQGSRTKILQANALELGNIAITWNPAAGSPIIHALTIYRDGQTIDVLKTASFEILRREDRLEAAALDGVLTATLRIPDLRVGDELELDWTSFAFNPVLGNHNSGILLLAAAPAPGRYRIGLSWETARRPNIRMSPDMVPAGQQGDHTLDFRFDNPPLLAPPAHAPPRYQWQRYVQFSDFADWEAVSRLFAPLYSSAARLASTSPLMAEAHRIASRYTSPLERAAAALKLVQQNVRYVYVGLNGGNLQPATADETWQRRFGDCKGKTVLLVALLKQMGIDAEPVLINTSGNDDGLEQRLPMPQLFDHILVRATLGGTRYWLDGTLPAVAGPSLEPIYPASRVLPLSQVGSPLERLVWRRPSVPDELSLYEADAGAGFDKPAKIVTTEIVRGVRGLQQYVQLSAVAPSQLLAVLRQKAVGPIFQTVDDAQWRYDEKTGASILKISGTGVVAWQDDGDGSKSFAMPGGGFNPPDPRLRAPGGDSAVPFYNKPSFECYVSTVRLPQTTKPIQWSSKPSFVQHFFGRTYYRAWELADGSIRMVRASRQDEPEISPATAQRDDARLPTFDNSMGWISYDPAGTQASVGSGEHVPAADAAIWTSATAPCMPTAAQR